jgi:uncharacterized membrane protein (DUF485 family)
MPELKLAIYKWLLIDMVTQSKAVTETSSSFLFLSLFLSFILLVGYLPRLLSVDSSFESVHVKQALPFSEKIRELSWYEEKLMARTLELSK